MSSENLQWLNEQEFRRCKAPLFRRSDNAVSRLEREVELPDCVLFRGQQRLLAPHIKALNWLATHIEHGRHCGTAVIA